MTVHDIGISKLRKQLVSEGYNISEITDEELVSIALGAVSKFATNTMERFAQTYPLEFRLKLEEKLSEIKEEK